MNSISTIPFIGQKVKALEEPGENGNLLCRTYDKILKLDVTFSEKELEEC